MLTIKELRVHLDNIQTSVDQFFSCVGEQELSSLLSRFPSLTDLPANTLTQKVSVLLERSLIGQSDLLVQQTENGLLRLLLNRSLSVLKLLLFRAAKSDPSKFADLERKNISSMSVSDLVFSALILAQDSAPMKPTMNQSETAGPKGFELVIEPHKNVPRIDSASSSSTIKTEQKIKNRQRPPRTMTSMHNQERSRTRVIDKSRLLADLKPVLLRVKELEGLVEELKRNEQLLLAYPDPYGPCSARPTGNALYDMEMQIKANRLRIQLLEKHTSHLHRVLEQRKLNPIGIVNLTHQKADQKLSSMAAHSSYSYVPNNTISDRESRPSTSDSISTVQSTKSSRVNTPKNIMPVKKLMPKSSMIPVKSRVFPTVRPKMLKPIISNDLNK